MYELADGTKSTDYKVGDRFLVVSEKSNWPIDTIVELEEDDESRNPYFRRVPSVGFPASWSFISWWKLKGANDDEESSLEEALTTIQTHLDTISMDDSVQLLIGSHGVEIHAFGRTFIADSIISVDELVKCATTLAMQEYVE